MKKQRMYRGDKINGTARHPGTDTKKVSIKHIKEKEDRREKEVLEIEEARAMGISYGKYRMLKECGKLPRYIPIAERRKPEKRGVYVPAKRGLTEFNEARERMFTVAASKFEEEKRERIKRSRFVDSAASNYMDRMRNQKEVVERAAARSNQCNS